MKRFISYVATFIAIPFAALVVIYFVTDPYKTLHPFSLEYFDSTNRDYLSSELFLKNYAAQKYDSFIFGSSRGCGINTYHWKKYLPEDSRQFLFQAWSETLTGIEEKICYIDEHGYKIKNALLLFDCPGSFCEDQLPKDALSIKHPAFSQQSKCCHQISLLFDFMQKPSEWMKAIKRFFHNEKTIVQFDPISNDWESCNSTRDLSYPPEKDSLCNMTQRNKEAFIKDIVSNPSHRTTTSEPLINDRFEKQLRNIYNIFKKQGTDFRIVITPAYCYSFPKLNDEDLSLMHSIFGKDKVFDYSGYNCLTSDYNNFSDPNHFGLYVGWHIIEDIYGKNNTI